MTATTDPTQQKTLIETLLDFQERMDSVLSGAFGNHVRTYGGIDVNLLCIV